MKRTAFLVLGLIVAVLAPTTAPAFADDFSAQLGGGGGQGFAAAMTDAGTVTVQVVTNGIGTPNGVRIGNNTLSTSCVEGYCTATGGFTGNLDGQQLVVSGTGDLAGPLVFTRMSGGMEPPNTDPCVAGPNTLCLENDNFEITGTITGTQGTVPLRMVELTQDTGYGWFLNDANLEVFIKILNGCGINKKYWWFAGGITNLAVELKFRNTITGQTTTKTNPARTNFQTESNTSFFDGCPP